MRDCVDAMRLLADPRRPQPTYAKFQVVLGVRVRVRSGLANQAARSRRTQSSRWCGTNPNPNPNRRTQSCRWCGTRPSRAGVSWRRRLRRSTGPRICTSECSLSGSIVNRAHSGLGCVIYVTLYDPHTRDCFIISDHGYGVRMGCRSNVVNLID